ncbi:hypothetical protein SAY87_027986 [Trapa incisa]|uniref:Uncharacterized protein n=1 Tax=Trapa incisa TaxID=236973 RepID=A0AAN7QNE9_9MYRT|nr:hypothetical protein SAY87_027986 [Trapa incisa]
MQLRPAERDWAEGGDGLGTAVAGELLQWSYHMNPLIRVGAGRLHAEGETGEVYQIDYRGPETHSSSLPPPNRPHQHDSSPSPLIHGKSVRLS